MFRGSAPTKIDDRGRLKLPSEFRRLMEERYGPAPEVFLTSWTGKSALLYPLEEWEKVEKRLAEMPSSSRSKQRFLERVNYFGQQLRLDAQGRMVVPQLLRDRAEMVGDVVVSGRLEYLEIWNRERFEQRLEAEPMTEDDFGELAEYRI